MIRYFLEIEESAGNKSPDPGKNRYYFIEMNIPNNYL